MAKNLWYGPITHDTDWGGDESTENKPVAGRVIQDYIKSNIKDKVGYIYHDQVNGYYLCFSDVTSKDAYLNDPTQTQLILGSLKAPLGYTAVVNCANPHYNAILLGKLGNKLEFGFDIKDSSNQSYIDNIDYTVTVRRNSNETNIHGTCTYGKSVTLNIDEYLIKEGTVTFLISIEGQTTTASATSIITFEVINLSLSNDYDPSTIIDLANGDPLVITYKLFGSSNLKYVDWYIDGNEIGTDTHTGGTAEALTITKRFSVESYQGGVHDVQFRAYIEINGEKFYTETLYREFIIKSGSTPNISIAIETTAPVNVGILSDPTLYGVRQYEPYTFSYGVYNTKNLDTVPVEIYIDNTLVATQSAPNDKELTYTFVESTIGSHEITIKSGDVSRKLTMMVEKTSMDISEITDNLILSLSAVGRSNDDSNRTSWTYNNYKSTFKGFTWSSTSGWVDNRLVIGEGNSLVINIYPLTANVNGKTIELEFESINVIDDDTVICDVRDTKGIGLLITATEASLRVGTAADQVVSTRFKSNENIRVSFVLDNITKMALIYINGVVSGAIKISSTTFNVSKTLQFIGSEKAGIKLKQILVYETSLNSDQILNNYILYRDTVDEMVNIYEKNDILDGPFMSIEKVASQLPVMLITGDVNWIETQTDKDAEVDADAEYIDHFDPTRSFKLKGGRLRLQGTSSSAYPKKNFRLYTERKKNIGVTTDWKGNVIPSNEVSFRLNPDSNLDATPVKCWCLKADYAESSSTHNTGIANIWNRVMYWAYDNTDGFVCRTAAQKAAIESNYPYDVRTTVDGFPIAVFARQTEDDEYIFIGKYNFNNDKSTENVFGFCDIPGFDNSKMQCWEILENGNNYALFQTTEGWYDQSVDAEGKPKFDKDKKPVFNWASGFEARYPDDGNEADTTDLKAFADWLISCDSEKFNKEKKDHLDLWKVAAYYVYIMRFGAVDQVVKNTMLTSEDGEKWYFINYDNDTINGLKNTGALIYPPTITRETKDGTTYVYAGHESRLWNLLEGDDEFIRYVSNVDTLLYQAGLTYENVLKYFNTNQCDKWCERIYNQDAMYKYITPSTTIDETGKEVNTLFMLQGSRKAHRTWWLAKRFKLMDGKFNNGNYTSQNIMLKLNGSPGLNITVRAGDYMYYGCKSNSVDIQLGIELSKGEYYTFHKNPAVDADGNSIPDGKDFVVGDPVYIYAPYAIEELDLSDVAGYLEEIQLNTSDPVLGTRLKKLVVSPKVKTSQEVKVFSGLSTAPNLEYLDLRNLQIGTLDLSSLTLLKTLLLKDSTLANVVIPDGGALEQLQLSTNVKLLSLSNLSSLSIDNVEGFKTIHIPEIHIHNCSSLTNDFSVYFNWIDGLKAGDVLDLVGLYWEGISPENLLKFKKFKQVGASFNLKGKVVLSGNLTTELVEQLKAIFGEDCFVNNGSLWISAPESVFIHGVTELRSGDSAKFTTTIFSENPGTVTWEIGSGEEWVASIVSNPDNTGTLTTIEDTKSDHQIVIKAIHKPTSADTYMRVAEYTVTSKRVIYPTEGLIEGNSTIIKDTKFTLKLAPTNFNGDYSTNWELTGNSAAAGDVKLSNKSKSGCTVKYVKSVTFELCKLIAHVSPRIGPTFDVELTVTITDDKVLMTSTSNPEVIAICYANKWCESPDVMYKEDAQKVTDIGLAFCGIESGSLGSKILHFDEFKEFWNVHSIPDKAFQMCNKLKSIKLPDNISSIGVLSFQSTSELKELHIPSNVVSIRDSSFTNSGIAKFTSSSINYSTIDDVLIDNTGKLIKYPEGKTKSTYETPAEIKSIGDNSLINTKLTTLKFSDNVVSIGSGSSAVVSDNKLLTQIEFGSSVDPTHLAKVIYSNPKIEKYIVSENHATLTSVNGKLYDKSQKILWMYPSGLSLFEILPNTEVIGAYSVAHCSKLSGNLKLPNSIKRIQGAAFYNSYNITSFECDIDSNLEVIDDYGLQLLSNVKSIILSPKLRSLGRSSLASIPYLELLKFLGTESPELIDAPKGSNVITTVFGHDANSLTGRLATNRVVKTPSNATGFSDIVWLNSIFAESRNNFKLSQTED